jgi:hypothetical protein
MKPFSTSRVAVFVSIVGAASLASSQVCAAPVQPLPSSAPAVQVSPPNRIIYVKDFSHLADLTAEDAAVAERARNLSRRQMAAYTVGFGGEVLGWLVMLASATLLARQTCDSRGLCLSDWNMPAFWSGTALALASPVAGIVLRPSRRDLLDLVNAWNSRHADEPLTLDTQPARWGSF